MLLLLILILPSCTALTCLRCSSVVMDGKASSMDLLTAMSLPLPHTDKCHLDPTAIDVHACATVCVHFNVDVNVANIIDFADAKTMGIIRGVGRLQMTSRGCLSDFAKTSKEAVDWLIGLGVSQSDITSSPLCFSSNGDILGVGSAFGGCVCASEKCNGGSTLGTTTAVVGTKLGAIDASKFTEKCPTYDVDEVAVCATTVTNTCADGCANSTVMCCTKGCSKTCVVPFPARSFKAVHCSQVSFANHNKVGVSLNKMMGDNAPTDGFPKEDAKCMESPAGVEARRTCEAMAFTMHFRADLSHIDLPTGVQNWLTKEDVVYDYGDKSTADVESLSELGILQFTVRSCLNSLNKQTDIFPRMPSTNGEQCLRVKANDIFGINFDGDLCVCNEDDCNVKSYPKEEDDGTVADGQWSAWTTTNMGECCLNKIGTRRRYCEGVKNGGQKCLRSDGDTFAISESVSTVCACVPIHGNWSEWQRDLFKGTCCEAEGKEWFVRYCREPSPAWGGNMCLKTDNERSVAEYMTKNCKCNPDQEDINAEYGALMLNPKYMPGNVAFALTYGWAVLIPMALAVVAFDIVRGE